MEQSKIDTAGAAPAPQRIKTDGCVIGAGSGGLSVAAGAVQMGARRFECDVYGHIGAFERSVRADDESGQCRHVVDAGTD